MNFDRWDQAGRDNYSRPIANNTRVKRRGEDEIAICFHATDIVTFRRDGTIRLAHGGWTTRTTKARIEQYAPVTVISRDDGKWFLRAFPEDSDPQPTRAERTIPKPFHALDPGDEPQKGRDGCLAGHSEPYSYVKETYVFLDGDRRPGDWPIGSSDRVERWHNGVIEWGAESWRPQSFTTGSAKWASEYKQCPHCKAFDVERSRWDAAMNGASGYATMVAMLDRFGTHDAWQEAYIEEFRAVRDQRSFCRDWSERNLVPFIEPIEITADGYVCRIASRAWRRAVRDLQRRRPARERRAARAAKKLRDAETKRKRQWAAEREVRREIAAALAGAIVTDLEIRRVDQPNAYLHLTREELTR